MPGIFIALFVIMFCAVMGFFIFALAKGVSQWNKNNHTPKLSVMATAVTKRMSASSHFHNNGVNSFNSPSTSYFVTFEVESGDRMEFRLDGNEYGLICEGDYGKLTFQGTRYISFDRDKCLL